MISSWLSPAEITSVVESVSLGGMLATFNAKVSVHVSSEWVGLGISASDVPDRDNARRLGPLLFSIRINRQALQSKSLLLSFLRRMVIDFMKHEADEALLVAGQRIFDPHAEEERARARHQPVEP